MQHNKNEEISIGSLLWDATKMITKFTWFGTKFVVKNAPAALGMAWEIKKEISNEIAKAIQEGQKAHKENLLESKISSLKKTNTPTFDKKPTLILEA